MSEGKVECKDLWEEIRELLYKSEKLVVKTKSTDQNHVAEVTIEYWISVGELIYATGHLYMCEWCVCVCDMGDKEEGGIGVLFILDPFSI